MSVGIEKIQLYGGRFCLESGELARARKLDAGYLRRELLCDERSVVPPYEDSVTLAVNAVRRLLEPSELEQIELLIVATESGLDFGKPLSTWVHRFCGLPPNCRNLEVKHACYGCTGALNMAAAWVAAGARPGKKALVVNTDHTRFGLGAPGEPLGGGVAVAMLVSHTPQILDLDLDRAGIWTREIADTFRPTARMEVIQDQVSVFSYLDALEGAFDHFLQVNDPLEYDAHFQKHIYHAPFPGMTRLAHRTLLARWGIQGLAAEESFSRKVAESLCFARRLGSCYGGSNFVCLLGLLHAAQDVRRDARVSLFSYGSGCQGEFYGARIGPEAGARIKALQLDRHLDERRRLSVEEYEWMEYARERNVENADFQPGRGNPADAYEALYAGRGLLVLEQVKGYIRRYGWS